MLPATYQEDGLQQCPSLLQLSKHRLCLHQDSSPEELCLAPHFPHELVVLH